MIENEVDSKIRHVIGQSLPLKSKRLSLNRLKCFHEAAQRLLGEAMDEPTGHKRTLSSFSTDGYTKNKLSRIIFLLNILLYTKVRKSIQVNSNSCITVHRKSKLKRNSTKSSRVYTNKNLENIRGIYDDILKGQGRTNEDMHRFLSEKAFPYIFYSSYTITKEIAQSSTTKGEICARILALVFEFCENITAYYRHTMETIANRSKSRKEKKRKKMQIVDDTKAEIFRQRNCMMENQFEDQKKLSIALSQVDKKIRERGRKNDEVLKALVGVRKLHQMFMTRNSSKIVESGREKLFRAMSKISVSKLIDSISLSVAAEKKSGKTEARARLTFLVGQVANSTNVISKKLNTIIKTQIPYAPLSVSVATNTAKLDIADSSSSTKILKTSKKIWQKGAKNDSDKWILKHVHDMDYLSEISLEVREKMKTTISGYSKPKIVSEANILNLILELYVSFASEKSYSKHTQLDMVCYMSFLSKYRIKKVSSERFIDFLFSLRRFEDSNPRIKKFLKHINRKSTFDVSLGNEETFSSRSNSTIQPINNLVNQESAFRYGLILSQIKQKQPGKQFIIQDSGKAYALTQSVLNVIRHETPYFSTESKLKIEKSLVKNRINIDFDDIPRKYHNTLPEDPSGASVLKDVVDVDHVLSLFSSEEEQESHCMCNRLQRLFHAADSDASNDLSFKEFKVLLTSMNPSYKPEEIGALYRQCLNFEASGDVEIGSSPAKNKMVSNSRAGNKKKAGHNASAVQYLDKHVSVTKFVGAMTSYGVMSTSYMEKLASNKLGLFFSPKCQPITQKVDTIYTLDAEWQKYKVSVVEMLNYLDVNANTPADAWHVIDNKKRVVHFEKLLVSAKDGEVTFDLAWDTYRLMRYQIESLIEARTRLVTALGPLRMLIKFKRRVLTSLQKNGSIRSTERTSDEMSSVGQKHKNIIKSLFSNCRWNKIDQVLDAIEDNDLSLNVKNEDGSTLVHVVAQNGHFDLAEILCDLGASVNAKDKHGLTPIDYAMKYKYMKMVELFNRTIKEMLDTT